MYIQTDIPVWNWFMVSTTSFFLRETNKPLLVDQWSYPRPIGIITFFYHNHNGIRDINTLYNGIWI